MSRHIAAAWDPDGEQHGGLPTYPWDLAPKGLATRRQLRAAGLRPGGQDIAAQILWRRGGQLAVAYLYRIDAAQPVRTPTAAQLIAIGKALLARQVCPTCGNAAGYYIPRRLGECLDCHTVTTTAADLPAAA